MAGTVESILSAGFIWVGIIGLVSGVKNKHKAKLLINKENNSGVLKSRSQWTLALAIVL